MILSFRPLYFVLFEGDHAPLGFEAVADFFGSATADRSCRHEQRRCLE
jgi:hypothetical protein